MIENDFDLKNIEIESPLKKLRTNKEKGDYYERKIRDMLLERDYENVKLTNFEECFDIYCEKNKKIFKVEVKYRKRSGGYILNYKRYKKLKSLLKKNVEVWVFLICKNKLFTFHINQLCPYVFVDMRENVSVSLDDKIIVKLSPFINKEFDGKWSNYFNYLIEEDIKSRKDKNNK